MHRLQLRSLGISPAHPTPLTTHYMLSILPFANGYVLMTYVALSCLGLDTRTVAQLLGILYPFYPLLRHLQYFLYYTRRRSIVSLLITLWTIS